MYIEFGSQHIQSLQSAIIKHYKTIHAGKYIKIITNTCLKLKYSILFQICILHFKNGHLSLKSSSVQTHINMWSWLRNKLCANWQFRNPLRRIQSAWQKKTPKQKWNFFFNFGKVFDNFQIRIFSDCHIRWLGWLPSVTFASYFSLVIYTVYFYISLGQFQKCLLCFCVFGLMIAVSKH